MLGISGRNPTLSVEKTGLDYAAEDIVNKITLRNELQQKQPHASRYDRKEFIGLY